jgi:hypothetical protein
MSDKVDWLIYMYKFGPLNLYKYMETRKEIEELVAEGLITVKQNKATYKLQLTSKGVKEAERELALWVLSE